MKNLFFILSAAFLVVSCAPNVEQYRESIESLTTEWNAFTPMVEETVNNVQMVKDVFSGMGEMMPTMTEGMDASAMESVQALTEEYNSAMTAINDLQTTVGSFAETCMGKKETIDALNAGLESGAIDMDVAATVQEMTTMMTEGKTQMEAWNKATNGMKIMATSFASKIKPEENSEM